MIVVGWGECESELAFYIMLHARGASRLWVLRRTFPLPSATGEIR